MAKQEELVDKILRNVLPMSKEEWEEIDKEYTKSQEFITKPHLDPDSRVSYGYWPDDDNVLGCLVHPETIPHLEEDRDRLQKKQDRDLYRVDRRRERDKVRLENIIALLSRVYEYQKEMKEDRG